MTDRRALLQKIRARRVVIKIGSGVLTDPQGRLEPSIIGRLADEIAPLFAQRLKPVVVSSGAIAVGVGILGLKARPQTMAGLQAAAAIGQGKLLEAWSQAFAPHHIPAAQVLLTHADLANRKRFLNARRALGELERRHAIPIINENDSVSYQEIALGDNDELAAQVSNLIDAELLIMLSTAPGVLRQDGSLIVHASHQDPSLDQAVRPERSRFGRGGMDSKLKAARAACARGAAVVILEGKRPGAIGAFLEGEEVGTLLFPANEEVRLSSRDHWILHTLRPAGAVRVDAGAKHALTTHKKSLLPSGITQVYGQFAEGDAVDIGETMLGDQVQPFARGLTRYPAEQLRQICGRSSGEIADILGFSMGDAVVHRDDLVLLDR